MLHVVTASSAKKQIFLGFRSLEKGKRTVNRFDVIN